MAKWIKIANKRPLKDAT